MQVVAIVVAAIGAGAAGWFASAANGAWQDSVREETKRSNQMQEQVRTLYGDEAPFALRVVTAQVRAEELRAVEDPSRQVTSERVVAEQMAFVLDSRAEPGTLSGDPAYALPGGGFDMARRLADLRGADPPPDPDRTAADGDDAAATATAILTVVAVITGLAAVAACARTRRRGADPELFPQPGAARRAERRQAFVLLGFWAAAALLPFAQLVLGGEEQRSQAAAARTAVRTTGQIAVSLARTGFEADAVAGAGIADAASTARELAALDATDAAGERALAAAEGSAAGRTRTIARQMGAIPRVGDGVDGAVLEALASDRPDWLAAGRLQEEQADRAGFFGDLANAVIVIIAVLAVLGGIVEALSRPRA